MILDDRVIFDKNRDFKRLGEFQNEYGEQFVVYMRRDRPSKLFITGDELNWETGWQIDRYNSQVTREFALTAKEKIAVIEVIENY